LGFISGEVALLNKRVREEVGIAKYLPLLSDCPDRARLVGVPSSWEKDQLSRFSALSVHPGRNSEDDSMSFFDFLLSDDLGIITPRALHFSLPADDRRFV
jgi:hypothetical protein